MNHCKFVRLVLDALAHADQIAKTCNGLKITLASRTDGIVIYAKKNDVTTSRLVAYLTIDQLYSVNPIITEIDIAVNDTLYYHHN